MYKLKLSLTGSDGDEEVLYEEHVKNIISQEALTGEEEDTAPMGQLVQYLQGLRDHYIDQALIGAQYINCKEVIETLEEILDKVTLL